MTRLEDMFANANARSDALLEQVLQLELQMLEELRKEKNFKVDDRWAGRYGLSLGFVKG